MATETLHSARVMPNLCSDCPAIVNQEAFIQALRRNQSCVGQTIPPAIGDTIGLGSGFNEEPCFKSPPRSGFASNQFQIEMFDPDRSRRKPPFAFFFEA